MRGQRLGYLRFFIFAFVSIFAVAANAQKVDKGTWHPFGGISDGCNSLSAAAATAANGDLYVGGVFNACGDAPAEAIARWDGTAWHGLGAGLDSEVLSIAFAGTDVYAGGIFTHAGVTPANGIARWDGSDWSALGSGLTTAGLPSTASAIAAIGTDVYVGGSFDAAGGVAASSIARWDSIGKTWSALGSGITGQVKALAVISGKIYAGGSFTQAGGNPASNIAVWDGANWSALGSGASSTVNALAVSGTTLYVGGNFIKAGGATANHVAAWNGAAWSSLGSGTANGVGNNVFALAVSADGLYVGGRFLSAGGVAQARLARWNGSAWSGVGAGTDSDVRSLAAANGNVYAAGLFNSAGSTAAHFVASWNGAAWSTLGASVGNGLTPIGSVSGYAGEVCVGSALWPALLGQGNLVCWDGSSWAPLGGSPFLGNANALLSTGQDLYVGVFDGFLGGIEDWNGTLLNTVASGLDGAIVAIARNGANFYVGGSFINAGATPAEFIAQWDGSAWHALGSGMDSPVVAVAVLNGKLYAGGPFSTAGGNSAPNLAVWNGTAWSSVGSGIDGPVNALLAVGNDLYVGGTFTHAGGNVANGLARWDGTSWHSVGMPAGVTLQGNPAQVTGLTNSGNAVFVGGHFDAAGGIPANNVARWDGTAFTSLGGPNNGIDTQGHVQALSMSGQDLIVGGYFGAADGQPSSSFAVYTPDQIFNGAFENQDYVPTHCDSVANTLNIFWEAVAGSHTGCTGIEYTDGSLSDAAGGTFSMHGVASVDLACVLPAAYTFTLSLDQQTLSGNDTVNNIPMTLTLDSSGTCFVGHWVSGAEDYIGTIWNFAQ